MKKLKTHLRLAILFLFLISSCYPSNYAYQPGNAYDERNFTKIANEVLIELNFARQAPQRYANYLIKYKSLYSGKYINKPGNVRITTVEGVRAVDEAINYLRKAKPLPPFLFSKGMSKSASDHLIDHGPKGIMGHKGSDGSQPWDRLKRYGQWQTTVGENLSFGIQTAREIVMGLIIDDGIPDRGHRENIFNPDFKIVGIAAGYHKDYDQMCVIDFAGGFFEK